jgi:hypothetical protein
MNTEAFPLDEFPNAADQSNPETGEWTYRDVLGLPSQEVADKHNAALAAEREKHCKDCCCSRSWEALGDFVKGVREESLKLLKTMCKDALAKVGKQ